MARVLGIGIATLDIINTVARYPVEDAEVRALSQRIARGGNATNTLVVLSQLGHDCAWAGTLAAEPDAAPILQDLHRHGIDTSHCRMLKAGKVPVSYIALSAASGSRTIVHFRDLPELTFEDLAAIDLGVYQWLHFEGRNVNETARMLEHARLHAPRCTVSLEVEKPRAGIERLFAGADVLLFSRAYAEHRGYHDGAAFLHDLRASVPQLDLVCAWGEGGAHALDRHGATVFCGAAAAPQIVDTLGAGDTFNAGVIHARLQGTDWQGSLAWAARLAARKIGQHGFDGLGGEEAS